jgi:hypothetical protein
VNVLSVLTQDLRLVVAPSSLAVTTLSFVHHECYHEKSYPTVEGTSHFLHSHFNKPLMLQIFEDVTIDRVHFSSRNACQSSRSFVTMTFKLIMNSNLEGDAERENKGFKLNGGKEQ